MAILVATDFSPCSANAVRLAVATARKRRLSLILLHVVEPLIVDPNAAPMAGELDAAMSTNAEQILASQAAELRKTGLEVEVQVSFGWAAGTVLDVARNRQAELVVLGTHGRRGAAKFFLGSCADEVVRASACPVLVVGSEVSGLDRWSENTPLNVAIVTDGSRACEAAIAWVRGWEEATAGHVSLVRLYWPPQESARYGVDEPWSGQAGHPDLVRLLERDLRRDARSLIGVREPRVRIAVALHDAGQVVAHQVSELGADAVVVGVPRHRRGTSSGLNVGSVLRSASVPIFCIPEASRDTNVHIPKVRAVLVGCDLSDASIAAIPAAYGLLLGGGRVELVYVHVSGKGDAVNGGPTIVALTDEVRETIEARLRKATPVEAAEHGISTHVSVVEGNLAAEAILQAAERLDVDVIALASHGRSGLKRVVLGSVAEEVARCSPRPVLITRGFTR